MKNFYCNFSREYTKYGIAEALGNVLNKKKPIICCIGTDAVIGDSLGPLVGTMLSEKLRGRTYVYGNLSKPITAKDVKALSEYLSAVHIGCPILAIDAALGEKEELGAIKVSGDPVKPGLGVKKELTEIGNAMLIAVVDEKGKNNFLTSVRLSLVYRLAESITQGVIEYFDNLEEELTEKTNVPDAKDLSLLQNDKADSVNAL